MTTEELLRQFETIICNYNYDVFDQFNKFIPSLPEGEMIDFGTGQAKSALAIAMLNPKLKITTFTLGDELGPDKTIEDYKNTIQSRIEQYGYKDQITFGVGDSREFPWERELVALNIDSGHGYELTKDEIKRWVPFVKKDGLIFLDDYLVTRCGVRQAVDEYFFNGDFEDLNPGGMCQVFRKLI